MQKNYPLAERLIIRSRRNKYFYSRVAKHKMNLSCYTVLLSATVVALGLFPGPTKLVSAQNENHPPSCPAEVASLGGIQNGSRPTLFSINGLM